MILHDAPGDRVVTDVYAWLCEDLQTGLEGIFGMKLAGLEFQAVTSSLATAREIGQTLKTLPYCGKKFRLVRFTKAEVLETYEP